MSDKPAQLGKHSKSKGFYKRSFKKRKLGGGPRLLCVGVQGILITTGDKEKLCVPEAYSLLNEYGDKLYGPEKDHLDSWSSSEEGSEGEELARPEDPKASGTKDTREKKERRFASMNSGAKHVVFIRCSDEVNPTELVHHMLQDIHTTKIRKSRFCQRILPVVRVCHVSLDSIRKCALDMLEHHFHSNTTDSHTFCVHYKCRNNNSIKRDHVINMIAELVTMEDQYPHRVNFDSPELVVVVEIIRNLCCLAVVKDFHTFCKYNIHSLTLPPQDRTQSKDGHAQSKDGQTKLETNPCVTDDRSSDVPDVPEMEDVPCPVAGTGEEVGGGIVEGKREESSAGGEVGSRAELGEEPDDKQTP